MTLWEKMKASPVLGGKEGIVGLAVLAAIIFVVLPLSVDIFRLNLIGKYLTYAFVAVGLVMLWGHGGILSLGQGIFFGLGGYAMAMFLKLEASDPESTKIQSTPGIPDFMDWNQLTALPWFWEPFKSLPFTLIAVLTIPAIFAYIIGYAMFKRRVGGVYFSIITQAIALILSILIVGQQGYTGGVNGMTDLRTMLGWDIRTDSAKYILYFVNGLLLFGAIFLSRYIMSSKFGMLLLAMRDKEERVRFSGYDVSNFKIFIFCLAAMMSAVGGAMFTLQVGFMSPSFVGIVPSIEMVIFCAVGGRASLIGAVYGTLLVNYGKTVFSETYPELWLFLMGGLFISVVMFFPDGLAGIWDKLATKYGWFKDKVAAKKPEVSTSEVEAQAVLTESSTTSAAVSTDAAAKTTARKKAAAKEMDLPSAIESNKMRGAEA
ncbi:urea ABC transporter permease subunit UrtC [Methylophilus sp. 3sh_L]|jgi:urea transport system permease protein|uniref:urea ABC transporter permease subunit UrtC n=1 Tax=Methylophilus sp. 3sh_L TaxID=3377114 RepID=UPI00398F79D8